MPIGYAHALMGSGISVLDLNRYYGLPKRAGPMFDESQCGRRLGKYEGQEIEWSDCIQGLLNGIHMTSSAAVYSGSGCENGTYTRGATSIDIYSPRTHIGAIHSGSSTDQPGSVQSEEVDDFRLSWSGAAGCLGNPLPIWLRDVALACELRAAFSHQA